MRTSKYKTHIMPHLAELEAMLKRGADVKDVAKSLGVAYSTLRKYLVEAENGNEEYKELKEAYARGCAPAREAVESSLFRSATGYNARVLKHYKVKKIEIDPETGRKISEKEELVETYDEVHIPANTTAQMFWLANRAAADWKYKPIAADGGEVEDLTALADLLEDKK